MSTRWCERDFHETLVRRLLRDVETGGDPRLVAELVRSVRETTGRYRSGTTLAAIRDLAAAGYPGEAITLGRAVLRTALEPDLAAEVRCTLAELLVACGDIDGGVAEADLVRRDLGRPERLTAAAMAIHLSGLVFQQPEAAVAMAEALYADRCGPEGSAVEPAAVHDPTGAGTAVQPRSGNAATATAAAVLSEDAWWGGDARGALRLAELSARMATGERPRILPEFGLALRLAEIGRYKEALRAVANATAAADRTGAALHACACAAVRAQVQFRAGRWPQAGREASAAVAAAERSGTRLFLPLALTTLARLAAMSNDHTTAIGYVRRCRTELDAMGGRPRCVQHPFVEAFVTAGASGPRAAVSLLTPWLAVPAHRRALVISEPGAPAWVVRVARASGDPTLASLMVNTAESVSAGNPGYRTIATAALHARSLLESRAVGLARAAVEHDDRWARLLARDDLYRVATELEQQRADPGPARAGESPVPPAFVQLTPAERRIAELVPQGLTNRQIGRRLHISPYTVNYHLRGVFRKLGISSRVEIARIISSG